MWYLGYTKIDINKYFLTELKLDEIGLWTLENHYAIISLADSFSAVIVRLFIVMKDKILYFRLQGPVFVLMGVIIAPVNVLLFW
mgnify:CR=1 FL=1